ncbi:MAG: benzoylformate decarboxylase [Betaproteobacteria bacterium RIFCSPLOWO2_12_FULL_65_14]|nr:MAG: benzoylformate decarboxylase [Betaproteobacteria bacterium RIFCSPLOWO2_12_FULL_65_14]
MTRITGRAAFLQLLVDEGVTHLFGNPGTTELPIMEVMPDFPQLKYVLGLQEGGVLGMADGFCRASHRLAAANVHVAPGLGNAMGALYNAKFSGSPVILTAGQQEQGHGLLEPMLYEPLVPMAQPLVKWAVDVARAEDLPRILHRAAKIALTPPTGPVFLSLPGDVLDQTIEMDMGRPVRVDTGTRPSDAALAALAERLLAARRPAIVAGQELAIHDAFGEAAELAELLGAAVYQSSIPYSAQFPTGHAGYMGALTRVQKQVRATLQEYDLLLCLGADLLRMSVYSPVEPLPESLPVVHISERSAELGKNYRTDIAIQANVKRTLEALLPLLRNKRSAEAGKRLDELKRRNWSAQRESARTEALLAAEATPIDPRYLMLRFTETLPQDAVVVDEGLVSTYPLPKLLSMREPKRYYGLASGGLGFAIPGAVGISLALPGRPVAVIVGDGAAMYSVQGLWTAAHEKLPITYIVANNRGYRIIKERLVAMRATSQFTGMDLRDPEIDFVQLARSFGLAARRVTDPQDIAPALREAFASGAPNLVDVRVADGFGA